MRKPPVVGGRSPRALHRPSSSVTPRASSWPSAVSSRTATPTAGRPTEVSRTWVETPVTPASRVTASRGDQLGEPQVNDLLLLARCEGELGVRVVADPLLQPGEHVLGTEPVGAEQEHVAEALLVLPVVLGQRRGRGLRRRPARRLLLARPARRPVGVADAR